MNVGQQRPPVAAIVFEWPRLKRRVELVDEPVDHVLVLLAVDGTRSVH